MIARKTLVLSVMLYFACGCETTTLVQPEDVQFTENGTVTDDGRFFFIGSSAIYELIAAADGTYDHKAITTRDDCVFSGLTSEKEDTLYAACTASKEPASDGGVAMPLWSDLIRVDLTKDESDPARVATTRLRGRNFFPNGMAVDERGFIYISNTMSSMAALLTGKVNPAVIRVRVVDEEKFEIKKKPVVSMAEGGLAPNGLQIEGDRLWFVSGSTLYEAQIVKKGLRNLRPIYIASSTRMFDDFAVLPEGIIVIAEIPSPMTLGSLIQPDSWPPANDPSQLTFVSTGADSLPVPAGGVIFEYEFEHPMTPSSVTLVEDDNGPALYVTDYFSGGLHRVGRTAP